MFLLLLEQRKYTFAAHDALAEASIKAAENFPEQIPALPLFPVESCAKSHVRVVGIVYEETLHGAT